MFIVNDISTSVLQVERKEKQMTMTDLDDSGFSETLPFSEVMNFVANPMIKNLANDLFRKLRRLISQKKSEDEIE